MESFAELLVRFVLKKNVIKDSEAELYKYGFQIGLEICVCMAICFFIAIQTSMLMEGLVFWVVFFNIRSYLGGFHMNQYWKCLLLSCCAFWGVLYLVKVANISNYSSLCLILLLVVILWRNRLYCDKNRKTEEVEDAFFAKKLKVKLAVLFIISIILTYLDWGSYLRIIMFTLILIVISFKLGELNHKRYAGGYDGSDNRNDM